MSVEVPSSPTNPSLEMEVESSGLAAGFPVESREANIHSDGLLLYVAQAGYESGTTPLSSWIPIAGYDSVNPLNNALRPDPISNQEGLLDLFER